MIDTEKYQPVRQNMKFVNLHSEPTNCDERRACYIILAVNTPKKLGLLPGTRNCFAESYTFNNESCSYARIRRGIIHGDNKGNNKITELRTILQRESQNS